MFGPSDNDKAADFAREFLSRYTAVGFGALSKREVDLMLLQLLQDHMPGFNAKNDFDAAIALRTTKRKVRGLRDEISYREAETDERLKARLREELKNAEVLEGDHGKVMVQLDDAVLRGFAEKIVRTEYGMVDSSFNRAILQLSGEKFLFLAFSVLTDDERQTAIDAVQEIQADSKRETKSEKTPFKIFRDAFIMGAGRHAGKLCVSGAVALVTSGASLVLESAEPVKAAKTGIAHALKQAWAYFAARGREGGDIP